jgi:hypothetical protein
MSKELNIGTGVTAPFKVKEGTITITTSATAHGDIKAPVMGSEVVKGDLVEIAGEMTVAAHSSGVPIGYVANTPKWEIEPRINYTQAEAVSADMLREAGIETFFKTIKTVDAKASEGITAGKYVVLKQEVELSASSGSTATNAIALSAQDTNNRVIIGIL